MRNTAQGLSGGRGFALRRRREEELTSAPMPGHPSARLSFRERLEELRDAWRERREVRPLAAARDFDSQRALLAVLHGWCEEAAALIREVYGEDLGARVEPLEPGETEFSASVGTAPALVFSLTERDGTGRGNWTVAVRFAAPATSAEPQRRNGPWSRARLEQLLLSAIAAHERRRSTGEDG
ncbi:MAG: hypothetical protein WED87_07340 [Dehalococcoidia bacterium]